MVRTNRTLPGQARSLPRPLIGMSFGEVFLPPQRRRPVAGGPALAGCPPAESASAFPAGLSSVTRASVRPTICSERRTVDYTAVSQKGADQALWNNSELSLSIESPQRIQYKVVKITQFQQISISGKSWFGTRGPEVQILSPRSCFQALTGSLRT